MDGYTTLCLPMDIRIVSIFSAIKNNTTRSIRVDFLCRCAWSYLEIELLGHMLTFGETAKLFSKLAALHPIACVGPRFSTFLHLPISILLITAILVDVTLELLVSSYVPLIINDMKHF